MEDFAPVAVFAYNRPEHLRATLTALAAANAADRTEVYLFCDGPKASDSTDRIQSVIDVARNPEWEGRFASVKMISADANMGLAQSIIGGVTKVLASHGRAIILEDDLLVAPDFLEFMNNCLEFYRDDDRIASISGFSPLRVVPPGYAHDVMAVPRNCSTGWAIWKDRWSEIRWDARDADRIWRDRALQRRLNAAGSDRLYRLYRQLENKIDSWSIRFGVWQTISGRLTIYSVQNRVQNIGYDGSGVHSGTGEPINDRIADNLAPARLEWVDEDPAIVAAFRKTFSGTLFSRLKRRTALAIGLYRMRRGSRKRSNIARLSNPKGAS